MAAVVQNGCHLCIPLVAHSVEEMVSQMQQAHIQGADCVELRIDHLKNFNPQVDLQTLLKARTLPALVTYRPKWEGGAYEGDEGNRLNALRLALEMGADYVDVELQAAFDFMRSISNKKPDNSKVIVSSHNYQITPSLEDLSLLVARIQSTGADIVKIATTATNVTDVARIFRVLAHCQVPIIALVMTEKGLLSRLLCPKFGGYLTFGTLGAGKESAPGQPTLKDLVDTYKIRILGRDTKVFGIIGNPVSHSKGPVLHNQAFREIGFDGIYVPFLVDNIAEFLKVYSSPDFAGFSVTIPFKEDALKCCDEVDPLAQSIGAVNTIVRRKSDGKLIGYNTDCFGAISAIEDAIKAKKNIEEWTHISPLAGKLIVVIGAGGAGKAIAFGAKQKGARVVVANRNYERAKALASLVGGESIPLDKLDTFQPETGMILANTSSVGMHPNVNQTPIPKDALMSYDVVFDAVYTPKWTRLLQEAESAGSAVVSGLEMFIRQAMGQFELFTGCKAPEKLMRDIVTKNT
uniref:shikimate dehydrogenase (NADP(+)) n=1 Tax=Araucaria cunninghamii TaxID=56994 RepID=A0A0D6R304_ARACU